MMRPISLLAAAFCGLAAPACALTLDLPIAGRVTASERAPGGTHPLPVAAWQDGTLPVRRLDGRMSRTAWRLSASDLTTGQLMQTLRRQVSKAGFDIVFECADRECGGFDFRFAAEVVPAPAMQVDLGNFRYLAATRETGDGNAEGVGLLVSRTGDSGYVQLTEIAPSDTGGRLVATTMSAPDARTGAVAGKGDLSERLGASGRIALDGLSFATGESALEAGEYSALDDLAAYLDDHPGTSMVLVGHTDAEGSLSGNIALSERRAASVRDRLIERYGIAPRRLSAEGVGFLAPRAPNDTEKGRLANRRVEAVLAGG